MASIRSVGTQVASAANVLTPTNLVPGLPGTRGNGDLLLLFTSCRTNTPAAPATPAGWTLIANISGTNGRVVLFGRVVDGSESAPTVAWTGLTTGSTSVTPVQAQIACVAGLLTSGGVAGAVDVVGAAGNQAASTTAAAGGAAITTLSANAAVFTFSTRQDDVGTWATLAASDGVTWAKVAATFISTSGADTAQEWQWGVKATAGSVAAKTFTLTGGASFASSGVMVAFKEKPRPAVPTGPYGSVVHATSGLLHYWRLNEAAGVADAFDYKSTLDGAYVGSPAVGGSLIASEAGAQSVQFDGVNDAVDIPDAASLDVTAAISVEFWIDATAAFPANDTLIQKGGAWSFWSAGGAFRFEVDGANSAERPGGATPSGKYHVVGTYDRTTVRLYLNGVEVATGAATAAIIASTGILTFGRDSGGSPLFWAGKMSDVAIYNVALPAATVLAHYNAGLSAGPTTYFGALSLVTTFGAATAGRRKTFGQVARPSAFGAVVAGRRKTFGAVALPAAFAATTAASRRTYGQIARPTTVVVAVTGTRRTFGLLALPVTALIGTAGVVSTPGVTHFGASSLAVSLARDTNATRRTFGQVARPSAFGAVVQARRQTFGQVARASSFAAVTQARRKTFGVVARPVVYGAVVQGRRRTFGGVAVATIYGAAVQGRRRTFGSLSAPVAFISVIDGRRPAANFYGSVVAVYTFGALTRADSPVVVLNDADAVYLGSEAVDAVYAGAVKAWP